MNPKAITSNTENIIYSGIKTSGLIADIETKGHRWKQGIIDINTNARAFGGQQAALRFIDSMNKFLKVVGVEELGLKGDLIVVTDTLNSPEIFQVKVGNGKVIYRQAILDWEKPVTAKYEAPLF